MKNLLGNIGVALLWITIIVGSITSMVLVAVDPRWRKA